MVAAACSNGGLWLQADYPAMLPVCPLYPQQQTLVRGSPLAGRQGVAGITDKAHPEIVGSFPSSKKNRQQLQDKEPDSGRFIIGGAWRSHP